MKTVKEVMQESSGFRFVINQLRLMSSSGRKLLLNRSLMVEENEIQKQLELVDRTKSLLENPENQPGFVRINHILSGLKDIHTTISILKSCGILGDIELFEIKQLAMIVTEISPVLQSTGCDFVELPELEPVVRMLDPENQGIPHFYVYSAYSERLREIRFNMKNTDPEKSENADLLWLEEQELEEEIRVMLSQKLHDFAEDLEAALHQLSFLDVLIAAGVLSRDLSLNRPGISQDRTVYSGLFNPQVKDFLEQNGQQFQRVDIAIEKSPVLITGANMGGKTVLLQTVFLSQYLFQFGFFVPAMSAEIRPVEAVYFNSEEHKVSKSGLSSFAEEMVHLNELVKAILSGTQALVLLDELARTTNPEEGKAIVTGTLEFLAAKRVGALITTHYSGIHINCKKLSVKGLIHEKMQGKPDLKDLAKYMDYSLQEVEQNEAPAVGIRIAEILGVDNEIIQRAKKHYKGGKP